MYNIVLVEDEQDLSNLISKYLKDSGFNVITYDSGEELFKNNIKNTHLFILDIMLKGEMSGFDIIKKIKEKDSKTPIIFTSARDSDIDKVLGLELGSDDYLAKPYSIKELVLRVKNVIKRVYNNIDNIIEYKSLKIDLNRRIVNLNAEDLDLTSLEVDLLIYLLENRNKKISRDEILDKLWGKNYYGSYRVVDDLVRRVRKKIEVLDIETIYGFGYRLV